MKVVEKEIWRGESSATIEKPKMKQESSNQDVRIGANPKSEADLSSCHVAL
jgi:hypothetical protein